MPPKKLSEGLLSKPEQRLLESTARILTAIQYKEAHPEKTFNSFNENLAGEMVHLILT